MTEVIDGDAVAERIRDDLQDSIETLADEGVEVGLATVLMSDDPASETYVSMKQRDCEEVGIEGIHVEIDPEAPAEELHETIADLNDDPEVHGILVQMPVPDHVDDREVLRAIDPEKDVDGFHPENVGRLVAGHARYRPCTPHGVQKLLESERQGEGQRHHAGPRRRRPDDPRDAPVQHRQGRGPTGRRGRGPALSSVGEPRRRLPGYCFRAPFSGYCFRVASRSTAAISSPRSRIRSPSRRACCWLLYA